MAGAIVASSILSQLGSTEANQQVEATSVSLTGSTVANTIGAFAITVQNTGSLPITCTVGSCMISFSGVSPAYTGNSRPSVVAFGSIGGNWRIPFTLNLGAYWPMYEGTGTSTYDGSGNGHTGTLSCSGTGCTVPTWVAGGGLTFTSTSTVSNDVALGSMTGTLAYTGGSNYTLFNKFSISSFSYSTSQQMDKFYACNTCDGGFTISVRSTGVVLAQYSAGHTTTCSATITYTINTGVTYNMAVVLNYLGVNGQWALYMNGIFVGSNNSCPGYSVTAVSQSASLGPNYAATTSGLVGTVYSLYYFNRALSLGEIAALGNWNPTASASLSPASLFTLNPGDTVSLIFPSYFLGTNANEAPAHAAAVTIQLTLWGSSNTQVPVVAS